MKTATSLDAASSSTYTVRIPTPLKQAFDRVASLHERNGSQLVREFMRDYVQSNAKQALEHEQWFTQQVQATQTALKTGQQSSIPANAVHAWLESWGTAAELPAPITQKKLKASATPKRKAA
jgi:predicted transcriptional regulator